MYVDYKIVEAEYKKKPIEINLGPLDLSTTFILIIMSYSIWNNFELVYLKEGKMWKFVSG